MVEEENLYGCFLLMAVPAYHSRLISVASESEDINGIMAPVLQITPELHELCVESSVMLPMDVGSLEDLAVSTTRSPLQSELCQLPACADSEGVLTPSSEALITKELCGLLTSLETVSLVMTSTLPTSWPEKL
jgi:hypothetical protein